MARGIIGWTAVAAIQAAGCASGKGGGSGEGGGGAEGAAVAAPAPAGPFVTKEVEGRLWVFRAGAKELAEFGKSGELAKMVTRIGAGPGGMTLRAPDAETLDLYQAAKEGFAVRLAEGRMYVFRMDAKELPEFDRNWDLAKMVTRTGAGPGGMTLRAPDGETLDLYAASKPGFTARLSDGRVWIFRKGAKELAEFEKSGELAKMVTRVGAGPGGASLRAPDAETLDAWAVAR